MITNFASAHDSDDTLTIDNYEDEYGKRDEKKSVDSVWNFHVWNEGWMKRPDLGVKKFDGWQVIDSTPQEISDGMFRNGPASVRAIKEGSVAYMYDAPFVYAEVNADTYYYRFNPYQGRHQVYATNTDRYL